MPINAGDTHYRGLAAFKSLKVSSQFTNQCTEFQMCASAHTTHSFWLVAWTLDN